MGICTFLACPLFPTRMRVTWCMWDVLTAEGVTHISISSLPSLACSQLLAFAWQLAAANLAGVPDLQTWWSASPQWKRTPFPDCVTG